MPSSDPRFPTPEALQDFPIDYSKPPDYTQGALSPTQQKILIDWLVLKWGKGNPKNLPKCEMCKEENTNWVAGQHVVTPLQFINGSLKIGGVIYPVVAVSCSNCGNTHFVNAITAGVLIHVGGGKLRAAGEKEASNG